MSDAYPADAAIAKHKVPYFFDNFNDYHVWAADASGRLAGWRPEQRTALRGPMM